MDDLSFPVNPDDREQMLKIISSCIGTKFTSRFGTLMPVRLMPVPQIDKHVMEMKTTGLLLFQLLNLGYHTFSVLCLLVRL